MLKIGNKEFDTDHHTYIMAILNITPDSFSDGGKWEHIDAALRHTEQMIAEGADLIDIGGESTRPGYKKISDNEEIERIAPVIQAIKNNFGIPVSVDTYKSSVAKEALLLGADMINDIWGLKYDDAMASVIAEYHAACCLMHNKEEPVYHNFIRDVIDETAESIGIALKSGISKEKIMIDPGIGFGKTYEMNLELLKRLDEFCASDYPVLLGCSRKSVIGNTLHLSADQRLEGTLVTTVKAVLSGCAFVRVHDVKENFRAIKMASAIK